MNIITKAKSLIIKGTSYALLCTLTVASFYQAMGELALNREFSTNNRIVPIISTACAIATFAVLAYALFTITTYNEPW